MIFDEGAGVDVTLLFGGEPAFFAIFEAFANGQFAVAEEGLYPLTVAEAVCDRFRWGYAPIPVGTGRRPSFGTTDGITACSAPGSPRRPGR